MPSDPRRGLSPAAAEGKKSEENKESGLGTYDCARDSDCIGRCTDFSRRLPRDNPYV